jgi:hypothetical protein
MHTIKYTSPSLARRALTILAFAVLLLCYAIACVGCRGQGMISSDAIAANTRTVTTLHDQFLNGEVVVARSPDAPPPLVLSSSQIVVAKLASEVLLQTVEAAQSTKQPTP